MSRRMTAILQALLVTLLWSTSIILIKIGLSEIPALTFAGLRYGLAFACLLPFLLVGRGSAAVRALTAADWRRLALLGVVFYAITQGAHFLALSYLPAQTTSLLLSFAPVVVALVGVGLLAERPSRRQWLGVATFIAGAVVFLYPGAFSGGRLVGMAIAGVCLLASAGGTILGRTVNRTATLGPLLVTVISMGIGASALLVSGTVLQGMPSIPLSAWLIVVWLAVVNTALAFTLWNLTQRTLSAVESSVVNNTMLIQVAILAWIFLGEQLGLKEIAGLTVAALGVLLVQLGEAAGRRPATTPSGPPAAPVRPPARLAGGPDGGRR